MNSHVVPEFMYSPLYDDKHRFHVLSSKDPKRSRREQKGLRERLLCSDCETQISKHERYISRVFEGTIRVRSQRSGNLVTVQGLDYRHFRLFGLSVLWRAGASKQQFFEEIRLGAHEERLRKLILADDPGEPEQYGFFLAPIVIGKRDVKDLMVQPTHSRLSGHLCYRFVFGGLVWVFVVSNHRPPVEFRRAFIDHSGTMLMLVSELRDLTFIRRSMAAIGPLT